MNLLLLKKLKCNLILRERHRFSFTTSKEESWKMDGLMLRSSFPYIAPPHLLALFLSSAVRVWVKATDGTSGAHANTSGDKDEKKRHVQEMGR